MLIKEYRIALPLSTAEYRIAQLYMIQKKSREESHGHGSGVEILVNEPYSNGPGGSGQYTHKIFHIGSHLPGWFRAILPKSALQVSEEAWNAYPYTKTIYRCPFIEKFLLEIETRYLDDGGETENIFNLSNNELKSRIVDYLDIVADPISSSDYHAEEDPTLYQSKITGRGPLSGNWWEEHTEAMKQNLSSGKDAKVIMCAYKLCRVEFRYWGMQSKIESFIHDVALRKTMLRAHRQAWCWQDEYQGLTLEDIRKLEQETQEALRQKMAAVTATEGDSAENGSTSPKLPAVVSVVTTPSEQSSNDNVSNNAVSENKRKSNDLTGLNGKDRIDEVKRNENRCSLMRDPSLGSFASAVTSRRLSWESAHSGLSASLSQDFSKVSPLEKLQASSSSEEEFFDAEDDPIHKGLIHSSSVDMLSLEYDDDPHETASHDSLVTAPESCNYETSLDRRKENLRHMQEQHRNVNYINSTSSTSSSILFLVIHGGSVLDSGHDQQLTKQSDLETLKSTFNLVMRTHYAGLQKNVAFRLVPCSSICLSSLRQLASLSPVASAPQLEPPVNYNLLLGALPLFGTENAEYSNSVCQLILDINQVYGEFLRSEQGRNFNGTVNFICDSVGAILFYDVIAPKTNSAGSSRSDDASRETSVEPASPRVTNFGHADLVVTLSDCDNLDYRGQQALHGGCLKLDCDVNDVFMFGSSLGLVIAFRQMCKKGRNLTDKHTTSEEVSTESKTEMLTMAPPKFDKCFVAQVRQFLDPLYANVATMLLQTSCSENIAVLPQPMCNQLYNLFYQSDCSAVRIEPLILEQFQHISPAHIPRYNQYPVGDGISTHIVDTVQAKYDLLAGDAASSQSSYLKRNCSVKSTTSQSSDVTADVVKITQLCRQWWGSKRLDYSLFSPPGLQSFPANTLPYLLHASFWESSDTVAFILRQVLKHDQAIPDAAVSDSFTSMTAFVPKEPREKWLRRRTTLKVKSMPNHRANDVVVIENAKQSLDAKFMYGALDMAALSKERVDIYIMTTPPTGEWVSFGTELTDNSGRLTFEIPKEKSLSQGIYPVKMVVRGDHSVVNFCLAVLPPHTDVVVFSIDGSFTASVSIMGKDPKVRAGSVDVVRYWQELGYLIVYVTARPDMQYRQVTTWLAQHNFPRGLTIFMDGISAEPLKQKTAYLQELINEAQVHVKCAYGSLKDVTVYQQIGLKPEQIFIVGRTSKKVVKEATVISNGYAAHLANFLLPSSNAPVKVNPRMQCHRQWFSQINVISRQVTNNKLAHKALSLA